MLSTYSRSGALLAMLWLLAAAPARAQSGDGTADPGGVTVSDDAVAGEANADDADVAEYESTIVATRSRHAIIRDTRAVTVVTAEDLAESMPHSTSEALHLQAGVSTQKTNHGGGSPYVRGRTGQQTLLLIDGFRLNTSIARSGPNQYLNTIDIGSVGRIEVLRGAGSVLYGSDAIGGVVSVLSRGPARLGTAGQIDLRGSSADRAMGAHGQVETRVGPGHVLVGAGGRRVNDLRSGGTLPLAEAPVYDGTRQLFTGYDEYAAQARAVAPLAGGDASAAFMLTTQLEVPRTDKCVPEPLDCRWFEEQSYGIGYLRWERARLGALSDIEVGLAFSRTHEKRRRERAERDTVFERDRVFTAQYVARASVLDQSLGSSSAVRVSVGGDGYLDALASRARTGGDADVRGKYLDGSRYLSLAGFGFLELQVSDELAFTAGARLNHVRASVAADPEGGTASFVDATTVPVFGTGARVTLAEGLAVVANVDQGFRAPNLDDLTARSSEGPGFQLPNPDLRAETSVTFETGISVRLPRITGNAFAYQTYIDDFIDRVAAECPSTLLDQCGESENVFQITNSDSASVRGVEIAARLELPEGVSVSGTANWTLASTLAGEMELPQSKIPPLSGRVGVRFSPVSSNYFVETIAEWAIRQSRLSAADMSDKRIPAGGTPGYGVVHLRGGARLAGNWLLTVALHNLTDTAYRVHGSGVDAAGFGAVAALSARFGAR